MFILSPDELNFLKNCVISSKDEKYQNIVDYFSSVKEGETLQLTIFAVES